MANGKKKASKNKPQKNNYHHENDFNSKKRQVTPDKQAQNGAKKSDHRSTGSKPTTKPEPKSCFRQMCILFIIALMVAAGGIIYANEEYQILIERTLEDYEVQDKLHMAYDQLMSVKSQLQEAFLQLKSQIAEPESEKSQRPKRDSGFEETEDFEEMTEEKIVEELKEEIVMEQKVQQTQEQPQTIDEVSQGDIDEEPVVVSTEQVETIEPEHDQAFEPEHVEAFEPEHVEAFESEQVETFEQEQVESFEQEQVESFEHVEIEPLQVDITEQEHEPEIAEVPEHVEPEVKMSEPEVVKVPEPVQPEANMSEPEVVVVPEHVEPEAKKSEPEEFREEVQVNEPKHVMFTEPEPVQATEPKQDAISEPEQPQISEVEQKTRPVQPELTQPEPVQFTEPEAVKIPESQTNIVIEPEQPEITQPEIAQSTEPEITQATEPEVVHATEGKPTLEPVQPQATKLGQDKFNAPEPVPVTEQEKVPEPVQPEITKPEQEQMSEPVQPEIIPAEPVHISEPEIVTQQGQNQEPKAFTEKEQEKAFEQREALTEPDIKYLEKKISSMLDNDDDTEDDEVDINDHGKTDVQDKTRSMQEEHFHEPKMETTHESIKQEVVPEPIREEVVPEPIREEVVPEPIREEVVPELIREEVVPKPIREEVIPEPIRQEVTQEPIREEVVPEPIKEEVIPEPIREEVTAEPIREEVTAEPIREEVTPEPIREEVVPEPIREEFSPEPIREEFVPEPIREELVPEPVTEEVVQSTATETKTDTHMSEKEAERVRKAEEKAAYPNLLITNSRDYRNRKRLDSADQLSEEGDLEEALAKYDKVMQNYPNSPRANYGRGIVLDKMAEKRQSNAFLEQAIRSLDNLLDIPDVPDRLLLLGGRRLAERQQFRGWGDKSAKTWRHLVEKFPEDYNVRNQLGLSYILTGNMAAAKNAFSEVLSIHPTDGFAKVHLGFILKSSDLNFKEAIPFLQEGIATGEPGTEDGRFYFHLGEALQRTDNTEEAYKIYHQGAERGLFLSAYQRSLYNVWTLTSQPWWTVEETGYGRHIKLLEDNWKVIRDEAMSLLNANTGNFLPEEENLRETGDWKQLTLYNRGKKDKSNCNKAPKTCELIEQIPASKDCRRGQVKFSVMQPGVHVWPHCGPTNCRLRAHLGLVVPPGPKIRVVNETRQWQEGKVFVFDDSFEHEVWHDGDKPRMVLIVDFWHPQLDKETKQGLSSI